MNLEIGDISVSVYSGYRDIRLGVTQEYRPFLSSGKPEVILRLHYGDIKQISLGERVFGVDKLWGVYKSNNRNILRAPDVSPQETKLPFRLISLSQNFKSGELYIRYPNPKRKNIIPLYHPLLQLLYVILLSCGRGLLVHASGIVYEKRGFLFLGRAEAGKTTMARIWEKEGAKVLSDERIIVRKINGKYHIYGTPWPGQMGIVSNNRAPLEGIFFIRHSKRNRLTPIDKLDTVSNLFARSRLPQWDRRGLSFSLSFMERISEEIPSFKLGFYPDKSVIDYIKRKI